MDSKKKFLLASFVALLLAGCEDTPASFPNQTITRPKCTATSECASGVCNVETGGCVECMQNSDCRIPETPICDVSNHICVPSCKVDEDCKDPALPKCDVDNHFCAAGCTEDADCKDSAKPVCNVEKSICVECIKNENCTDKICNTERNVCVQCNSNADCSEGVCDTAQHVCVQCNDNADCSGGICNVADHLCVECNENSDCASGLCDTASHMCEGCSTHADCKDAAAPICNVELSRCEPCVAEPDSANKCPEVSEKTPFCMGAGDKAGQCVECSTGDDCQSGICIDNMCRECDDTHECKNDGEFCETSGPNANMCIVCNAEHPCEGDLICSEDGQCVSCIVDADCKDPSKPACFTEEHVCVECNSATEADNCSAEKPACDDAAHLCVICVRASEDEVLNASCQALDASKPVCIEDVQNSLNNRCVECNSVTSGDQCVSDVNKPICFLADDDDSNHCGPCTADEQCAAKKGPMDICNTESGACVECLTVEDCGEGMLFCESNKCGNCHESSDCSSEICIDNICRECVQDSDCKDPSKPVCAKEGVNEYTCVPCSTDTQDENCRLNDSSKPVCGVDDDASFADHCVECNPGKDPLKVAPDCINKVVDGVALPYCASTPMPKAHTCVECVPNPAESDTGIDDSCLNVTKDGILSQVCADERAAAAVQNTCVECDDDAVKTQCNASATAPICNIDSTSENAYHCMPCDSTDASLGNAQCAKKDSARAFCVQEGATHGVAGTCVECIESSDCASGSICNAQNQCVECTDRSNDSQCANPEKGVCCDEASFNAGLCTNKDASGTCKCEKCDITTNCIGGVCNETTGRCEPCVNDGECVDPNLGVCGSKGVCEKCVDSGEGKNCSLVCNATTGKCEPCVDVDPDPTKVNCARTCDYIKETCEPCDNETYYCHTGVCNLTAGDPNFGYCEPCSDVNCPDGTCGADGLCHKICSKGTLCTKDGFDISRESCCEGTAICTTAGVCITPGDECTKDTDCTTWDKCDKPAGADVGNCIPVSSDPQACFTIPEFETIAPKVKWHYPKSGVVSTPIVIDLTHDGVPEVIFTSNDFDLTAVDGVKGSATAVTTNKLYNKHNDIAAADIDNDGEIEVLVPSATASDSTTGLYIMNLVDDGTGKYSWKQKAFLHIAASQFQQSNQYWADLHPSVADIDEDGVPEIVTTRGIIKGNDLSKFACTMTMGRFSTWYYYMFAIADLDQDGNSEIIADLIYDNNCNAIDDSAAKGWGYAAVADIIPDDGTPGEAVPEIVRVKGASKSAGSVSVWKAYKKDGKWTQKKIWETSHPGGGGGNPVIADFDGDGKAEIGVAGGSKYAVFRGDTGKVMWSVNTDDDSSYRTGSSVFDFEADGKAEIVYRDQGFIRIYNGSDGAELWSDKSTSGTVIEYPLIVDVDGDNQTEIVIVSEKKSPYTSDRLGVTVYADTYGKWVPSRKLWNQHSYHVTNINDDGSVPKHEEANWLNKRLNNYRCNIPPEGFYNQPNFVPGLLLEDKTNCRNSNPELGLQATIANLGDKDITSDIQISYYLESADGTHKYYIGTLAVPGLAIKASTKMTYQWDGKTVHEITGNQISESTIQLGSIAGYKAVFVVDDPGLTGKPTYEECNESDNSLQTSQYLVLTGC